MKNTLRKWYAALFGAGVEFRAKIFNMTMVSGMAVSVLMMIVKSSNKSFDFMAGVVPGLVSFALFGGVLWYAGKTGKYAVGSIIAVIAIFVIIVPITYFKTGGYLSGHSATFLGFVVLTGCLLRGRLMVAVCASEVALYVALVYVAYRFDWLVTPLENGAAIAFDIGISLAVFGCILTAMMASHFRVYDAQQEELLASRAKEAALSRAKVELFTNMSHEIRTPLALISNYAQLAVDELKKGVISEQTIADLETISGDARRLSEMASGTLDALMSSIDPAAAEEIDLEPVDIREIAERVISIMRNSSAAGRMAMTVVWNESSAAPCIVMGDEGILMRLFWNMLFNAVTHSGGSEVIIRIRGAPDRAGMTLVSISDNGRGIAPELLGRVFDRGVSRAGGSGIGLSLCKDIMRLLGGEIWAENAPGGGTTFNILLLSAPDDDV